MPQHLTQHARFSHAVENSDRNSTAEESRPEGPAKARPRTHPPHPPTSTVLLARTAHCAGFRRQKDIPAFTRRSAIEEVCWWSLTRVLGPTPAMKHMDYCRLQQTHLPLYIQHLATKMTPEWLATSPTSAPRPTPQETVHQRDAINDWLDDYDYNVDFFSCQ